MRPERVHPVPAPGGGAGGYRRCRPEETALYECGEGCVSVAQHDWTIGKSPEPLLRGESCTTLTLGQGEEFGALDFCVDSEGALLER